jgi:16S rRNA (guanine527-N7)-methyltransferase
VSRALSDKITRRLRKAGASVQASAVGQLEKYLSLLARWNSKINLTAFDLKEPSDEAIDRLVVEPVLAAQHIQPATKTLIDIGSGSGSPAIPLLLATPGLRVTMVESKTRKAVFLIEALRHLDVSGSRVETARYEQLLTRPDFHEGFDALTVRAVRVEASTLLTLQAFLRPGGDLLLFHSSSRPFRIDQSAFPLVPGATVPLVESLASQLVVLRKDVPRGT